MADNTEGNEMTEEEATKEVIRRITNLIENRLALKIERDSLQEELAAIRSAWQSEHSMGGNEPPSAFECMLLALKYIRDLTQERDQAYAQLGKVKVGKPKESP